jgi:hypothetical protein
MDLIAQVTEQEATNDGQLTAGFLFASIKNVGTEVAVVNGVALAPGEAKSYPFCGKGYQSIQYQVQGSTLRIMQVI